MSQAIGILRCSDWRNRRHWVLWLVLLTVLSSVHPLFAQATSGDAQQPTAVVISAGLNIRSGPGLTYSIIGYLRNNQAVAIVGEAENCRWLRIRVAESKEGWISGKADYVTVNTACATILASEGAQAVPATQQTSNPAAAANTPTATSRPTTAPTPTPLPQPVQAVTQPSIELSHPPPGQGCYLLQNRLGPPITVTFTNRESGKSIQVMLPHGAEVAQCLVAGEYTYTISAVGYRDKNGEMKVITGDAYMLPIGG